MIRACDQNEVFSRKLRFLNHLHGLVENSFCSSNKAHARRRKIGKKRNATEG